MTIRQVFFDLNGTLFDPAALAAPLRGNDAEVTAEAILRDTVTLAMAETLTGSFRDFSELLRMAADRRLSLAGEADRLDEVIAASRRMRPFPDGQASIELLLSAGIGAGVLTNSSVSTARSLLANSNLKLDPVVGPDLIKVFKPHPRIYHAAAEAAGRPASEVALITAHDWDAIGAKRAGLRAAWVSRQQAVRARLEPAPEFEASDLVEAAAQIVAAG